jgi:hypothetical protein
MSGSTAISEAARFRISTNEGDKNQEIEKRATVLEAFVRVTT